VIGVVKLSTEREHGALPPFRPLFPPIPPAGATRLSYSCPLSGRLPGAPERRGKRPDGRPNG